MIPVRAYKCSFCKVSKLFLSRSGCRAHEKRCWLNPARRSCATCTDVYRIEGETISWGCNSRRDVVPFKSKITNCPLWDPSGTIFDNDYEAKP